MKQRCKQCDEHVNHSDLERHAREHNKTNAYKMKAKDMFEHIKYLCPDCGKIEMRVTYKGFVCQCCSFVSKPYAHIEGNNHETQAKNTTNLETSRWFDFWVNWLANP